MSGLPGLRARPLWLLLGWTMVFLIVYLSLTPAPVELPLGQGDKIGHVLAYATLMSWFANLYEASVRRLTLALGFVALGVSLEFLQRWTGYRSFEVADMVAGAIGVAAGWILAPPRLSNYSRWLEKFRPDQYKS